MGSGWDKGIATLLVCWQLPGPLTLSLAVKQKSPSLPDHVSWRRKGPSPAACSRHFSPLSTMGFWETYDKGHRF